MPVRYFPEASSASFCASCGYGLKILWVVTRYLLHRSGSSARAGCRRCAAGTAASSSGSGVVRRPLSLVRLLDLGRRARRPRRPLLARLLVVARPRDPVPRPAGRARASASSSRPSRVPAPPIPAASVAVGVVAYARRLLVRHASPGTARSRRTRSTSATTSSSTWNLARGAGPRVSLPEMHAWGDHLSPIMYLFVPAFWVAPGPWSCSSRSRSALALGALAVFGIARRRLGDERPGGRLRRALSAESVAARHQRARLPRRRPRHPAAPGRDLLRGGRAAVALRSSPSLLTLACREDAAIPVVGLGRWLALARRRWLWGGHAARARPRHPPRSTCAGSSRTSAGSRIRTSAATRVSGGSLPRDRRGTAPAPVPRCSARSSSADRVVYLGALLAPLAFLPLLAPARPHRRAARARRRTSSRATRSSSPPHAVPVLRAAVPDRGGHRRVCGGSPAARRGGGPSPCWSSPCSRASCCPRAR